METKICTKCKIEKPLTDFYKKKKCKQGVSPACKSCNIKKIIERRKELLTYHRDRSKKFGVHGDPKDKEYASWTAIKYTYGIVKENYLEMLWQQNNCCAICGKHYTESTKKLSVDHNHNTNEIRGLLCQNCNSMIGMAKENIITLQNAINYLLKFNKN